MKRPMLLLSLALICGILMSYYFIITQVFVFVFLLIALGAGVFSIYLNKDIWSSILLIIFILGIVIGNLSTSSKLDEFHNKNTDFIGRIISTKMDNDKTTLTIMVTEANNKKIKERIIVTSYNQLNYRPGDLIKVSTKLQKPNENTNPYLFNYRKYLLTNKIHYTATISDNNITYLSHSFSLFEVTKDNFRNLVQTRFDDYLDENSSSIMKGIILGGGAYLEENEYSKYKDIGLAHILAVSGLHMGIISSFILFIFAKSGIKRNISIPITMVILFFYSYLIGFPPATFRALVMFSLIYLGKLILRPIDFLNIIFSSMFISLLYNPMWIHSTGFLLSYGAIISIGILGPKIKDMFYPYKNKIIGSLSTTIAVSIGILPIQVYNFNAFPIYSFISNIIIIPVVTINVILGFLFIIFKPVGFILNVTLGIQTFLVDLFHLLPYKTIGIGVFSISQLLIYFALIIIWYNFSSLISLSINLKRVLVYSLLFLSIMGALNYEKDHTYRVHFIDVGQGDSVLIQGSHNILIDGGGSLFGSFDVGRNITLPYLEKHGIRNLDLVILTHDHEDHYKGLIPVMEKLNISTLVVNKENLNDEILSAIKRSKTPYIVGNSNMEIEYTNLSLDFLWPYPGENYRINENNNSLVSLVKIHDSTLLFTGDIERDAEDRLVRDKIGSVNILKVAHHGSSTSSIDRFIQMITPADSIISVGRNNSFGHPSIKTLNTLNSIGSNIYRTDEMGRVLVEVKKDIYTVSTYTGPLYKDNIMKILYNYLYDIIYYCTFLLFSYIITLIYRRMEESSNELHRIY